MGTLGSNLLSGRAESPSCVEIPEDQDPTCLTATTEEGNAMDSAPLPSPLLREKSREQQLESTLKLLFSLQGASLSFPSLALLSIVTDRAAVPPAYLPAYGAIAFLPFSLKPVYAYLSSVGDSTPSLFSNGGNYEHQQGGAKTKRSRQHHKHQILLAVLLALDGIGFLGTAWLVPVGGVVACFFWGFIRGVTSAWSQFLMNQGVIRQAQEQQQKQQPGEDKACSYQELSSLFQSQALTYSNLGSMGAAMVTFCIFLWRHQQMHHGDHNGGKSQEPPLSDALVLGLIATTAIFNFIGSAVILAQLFPELLSRYNVWPISFFTNSIHGSSYEVVATSDEQPRPIPDEESEPESEPRTAPLHGSNSNTRLSFEIRRDDSSEDDSTLDNNPDGHDRPRSPPRRRAWTLQERSDVASLVFLQAILVGAALQHPILSAVKNDLLFFIPMVVVGACFFGAATVSSCCSDTTAEGNQRDARPTSSDRSNNTNDNVIPARRLGLYLMLRQSVPIASILMYYYIYAVFEREPLFLQSLSIIESAVSVAANWVYGRFLAQKYFAGWGIIALTAVLSIMGSLVSLLGILVVHKANSLFHEGSEEDDVGGHYDVDENLRWLVVFVSIVSYFMGQIGYIPSVVLTTANVVSSSKEPIDRQRESATSNPQANNSGPSDDDSETDDTNMRQGNCEPLYDEGMQYSIFMSCIGFGAQLGDWISIPIIKAFGITRENQWANLDHYILLCALLRIASVAFLWLIRPPESCDYRS